MSGNKPASKVWIAKCGSYSLEYLRQAVDNILSPILEKADLKEKHILLKPNMLSARTPEKAVTTNPVFVEAVIAFFQDRGSHVAVGDSPAGALHGVERVWDQTGIAEVCRKRGVELVNFEASGWTECRVGDRSYQLARCIFDFDRIVNLAKAKTHVLTILTGCVKNTFGCVPGFMKSRLHLENPSPGAMSKALVDIFTIVKPWVNLLDAIIAMEGQGPSSGNPKHLGFIAASHDGVALDAVFAKAVGIDPLVVPTTSEAYKRGLGEADLAKIRIEGTSIQAIRPASFAIPSNWKFRLVPRFMSRFVSRFFWVRPQINANCTLCGRCEEICPAGAILRTHERMTVQDENCLSCLCCHEICPSDAIDLRRGWLARLIG